MRLRRDKSADAILSAMARRIEPQELADLPRAWVLEIGLGRGGFLAEMASRRPETMFVGLERNDQAVILADRRMKALDNLRLVWAHIEDVTELIPSDSVSELYLNFSDPWPKLRHAKRRLTGRRFLAEYERILVPGGLIQFKTDNRELFNWTMQEFNETDRQLTDVSLDIASHPAWSDDIPTEYQKKFQAAGQPICGLRYRAK